MSNSKKELEAVARKISDALFDAQQTRYPEDVAHKLPPIEQDLDALVEMIAEHDCSKHVTPVPDHVVGDDKTYVCPTCGEPSAGDDELCDQCADLLARAAGPSRTDHA